jgi:hypothetical protein
VVNTREEGGQIVDPYMRGVRAMHWPRR